MIRLRIVEHGGFEWMRIYDGGRLVAHFVRWLRAVEQAKRDGLDPDEVVVWREIDEPRRRRAR